MSRHIDAEWLMNFFTDIPDNFTLTIGNLRATVNEAPSIDIVHCGECKHFHKEGITDKSYYCKQFHDRNGYWRDVNPDGFCSYGQKGDENVETD